MFRSLKKRATTAFKKKKGPNSHLQDLDDNESTLSFTRSTSDIRRDTGLVPPAPAPPSPPPFVPPTPVFPQAEFVPPPVVPVVAQDSEPRRPPDLLHFDEEPGPAQPVTDEPESDPFTPRYVPYVEASPLRNNMFAAQTSVYGRINPDIMGGFGDDSDSLWLVDDSETDEEELARRQQRQQDEPPRPDPDGDAVMREVPPEPPAVLETQSTGATAGDAAGPAFVYRTPTLLDDDEWLSSPTSTPDTTPPELSPPAPRRGYAPISDSILDLTTFELEQQNEYHEHEQNPPPTAPLSPPRDAVTPTSASSSTNPYVALFEQQDNAMTVAYLRRLEQSGDVLTDDFSFGQRYQKAADAPDVIVTHQRVPAATVTGEIECVVCTESMPVSQFPRFSITATCTHPPTTCLDCVQMSVESDLNNKLWTQIRCPECRELLEYADIQRYANEQTFLRYETLAIRAAMSEAENFFWCTSGCGSGQIHESGDEQPIVTCLHCNHRSCFHHNVAWHETLTCVEYDELLKDPENFRSRVELENEEWTEAQQAQLEADRAMAQGLLAEEQAELERREERARQEREQARKAAQLVRKIAARRKREEEKSEATVSRTTKPCPGCGWAIEKNDGCSHMTCVKCKHQFCYECGADHKRIMRGDNSAHGKTCKFHPSNMKDVSP